MPSKGARTRQYIIEKTAPLFNSRGFSGTSLSDLMDATGLSKGSLYGNFKDKEAIAIAVFLYSVDKVRQLVTKELENGSSWKDKLFLMLNFYAKYVFKPPIPGGCPLLNTAIEADDDQRFLKKYVAEEIMRVVNFITSLLDSGKAAGEFKNEVASRELAFCLFCSVEGAIMVSRVSSSDDAMKAVINHIVNEISIK
jgi:TetR/AcrR family transcriptional regulator, transcriptional repressor for nem operon